MKFKVGDRVRAVKRCDGRDLIGYEGTVKYIRKNFRACVGVEFDKEFSIGHTLDKHCKNGHGRYCEPESLELIKDETIVIYRKGNEVIALDKRTGKKTVAKCSPADAFNFDTGAKLAFERLNKNVTFRVLCVKTNSIAEKGKVYEFVDGVTIWKDGSKSAKYSDIENYIRRNSDFNDYLVELKDGDDPAKILKEYGREIRVGDTVKVMDTGRVYSRNTPYFIDNNVPTELMCKWDYDTSLTVLFGGHTSNENFTVKFVADDRCIIERYNGKCYLIDCDGVKKC